MVFPRSGIYAHTVDIDDLGQVQAWLDKKRPVRRELDGPGLQEAAERRVTKQWMLHVAYTW